MTVTFFTSKARNEETGKAQAETDEGKELAQAALVALGLELCLAVSP